MSVEQIKIGDLLKSNYVKSVESVSFEYFPPKTDAGDAALIEKLPAFKAQKPVFVDFTWGAGGTTSEKTTKLCCIAQEHGLIVNMHLTCTNMDEGKVKEALDFCKANDIRNILALRGDPPAGQEWKASAEGFSCALDLVKYIRANYGDFFSVGVAGYPEGHPNAIGDGDLITAENAEKEMAYLKEKIDAGAEYIITQLFYDVDIFLNWVQACKKCGINVPIIPGIMISGGHGGYKRMTTLCKTYVPKQIAAKFEELKEKDDDFKAYGVELAVEIIKKVRESGIVHAHFYTLNQTFLTFECMKKLGIYQE